MQFAAMRRHGLLVFSLLLIAGSGLVLFFMGLDSDSSSFTAGILLRAGIVLFAVWLAFPQISRIGAKTPKWLIGGFVLCGAVLVVAPKRIVIIGPVLLAMLLLHGVGWLLKPPPPRQSKRRPTNPAGRPRGKNR